MMVHIELVTALIMQDNKLLVLHKTKYNDWTFPGGKIDSGETPEDALARETQEEICCDLDVGEKLGEWLFVGKDTRKFCRSVYLCSIRTDVPVVNEPECFSELRWVSADELNRFTLAPRIKEALTAFAQQRL